MPGTDSPRDMRQWMTQIGRDVAFLNRFAGRFAGPRQVTGTAPPTLGAWERGSLVWAAGPVPGGYVGWVCTTAGTPGTWRPFGLIAP